MNCSKIVKGNLFAVVQYYVELSSAYDPGVMSSFLASLQSPDYANLVQRAEDVTGAILQDPTALCQVTGGDTVTYVTIFGTLPESISQTVPTSTNDDTSRPTDSGRVIYVPSSQNTVKSDYIPMYGNLTPKTLN